MKWPFDPPAGGFDEGSNFGPRQGGGVVSSVHQGVDFGKSGGTPIPASGNGSRYLNRYYGGYGNCTIMNHGNGIYTLYGHQQSLRGYEGEELRQRETVGPVGTTGSSTGNHLHFGTAVGGPTNFIDPEVFIPRYADYQNADGSSPAGGSVIPIPSAPTESDLMFPEILFGDQTGQDHPYMFNPYTAKRTSLSVHQLSVYREARVRPQERTIGQGGFDLIPKEVGSL
jgi:hypothetical protein